MKSSNFGFEALNFVTNSDAKFYSENKMQQDC